MRLRDFVINRDVLNDESKEQTRLLRYYKHRYLTFVTILKEALNARRVKGPAKSQTAIKQVLVQNEEESKGAIKVFSLKPSC